MLLTFHTILCSQARRSTRPTISVNSMAGIQFGQCLSHSASTRIDCANKLCLKTLVEVHIHSFTHSLWLPYAARQMEKALKSLKFIHICIRTYGWWYVHQHETLERNDKQSSYENLTTRAAVLLFAVDTRDGDGGGTGIAAGEANTQKNNRDLIGFNLLYNNNGEVKKPTIRCRLLFYHEI